MPCKPSGYPLGLVFKVQWDREAGPLCYVRMYSGSIRNASVIYNVSKKKRERITRLLRMHANKSEPIESAEAGDIAVIVGLKTAQTGDTIGTEGWPVLLERMHFPDNPPVDFPFRSSQKPCQTGRSLRKPWKYCPARTQPFLPATTKKPASW